MSKATAVAFTGVVLTLASFTFDTAPLFVPGVGFTLLGILTPLWVRASVRGARLRRRMVVDRVVEDQPVEAVIEVRRGVLGLPGGEVHEPLCVDPVALRQPQSLNARASTVEIRVLARFSRRGLRRVDPPSLVVHDCLDLARAQRAGSGPPQELLILPRTESVKWDGAGRAKRTQEAGGPATGEPMAAVDVDGLRPYRPGTPASRIHWAALARGAGLLERRLAPDADSRPLIILDPRGSGPPEHLDAAVRAAASLTVELARHAGCQLLVPGERRPLAVDADLGGWPGAHARLALVEGGPGARAPVIDRRTGLGPVFYVAAQPLERLPTTLTAGRSSATVLVVPSALCPRGTRTVSFQVSGCHGFVLGTRSASARRRHAA